MVRSQASVRNSTSPFPSAKPSPRPTENSGAASVPTVRDAASSRRRQQPDASNLTDVDDFTLAWPSLLRASARICAARAVCGRLAARPNPGAILRPDSVEEEDAANDDAVLQHVVVVIAPLARRAK